MNERQSKFKDGLTFEEKLAKCNQTRSPLALLVDQLGDVRNLGSIFRIADAANLHHIYCYRMDDFSDSRKLSRVARSTEKFIPYSFISSSEEVRSLQKHYTPVALEITNQSIPFQQYEPMGPTLLLIGNEEKGLSEELLSVASASIHIPMLGINNSMNVAVATGIAVYHLVLAMR